MMKTSLTLLMVGTALGAAYKYRYKLLDMALSNDYLSKLSVNTVMKIPGVKDRVIGSVFGK
ncbi:MAG TPA: hypothetical protein VKZ77_06825 [Bacillaceae bacterium]|uniref:Uncharacterized protein n=2 Tax=Lederbergia graminis TaxID=735518 RepID=A0ABW0LCQ2_9BACI|nr:hypothetical protein [Bacillaceae bacterium]